MDLKILKSFELFYKTHALQRMADRNIDFNDIDKALDKAVTIEDYPSDFPLPSFLALGFDRKNNPLHFVIAVDYDSESLYVITVYKPTKEKWNNLFTKRKEK